MSPSQQFVASNLLLIQQVLGAKAYNNFFGGIERRFRKRIEQSHLNEPKRSIKTISEVKNISPDEFKERFYKKSKAVIFRGAAKEWPCCKKWSLDFFAENYGQSKALLVDVPGLTNKNGADGFELLTTSELIKDIKARGSKYWRFSPLLEEAPELANDLNLSWLGDMKGEKSFGNTYYMFLGGQGRTTYLHTDQPCNLNVQVSGRKRWTIY